VRRKKEKKRRAIKSVEHLQTAGENSQKKNKHNLRIDLTTKTGGKGKKEGGLDMILSLGRRVRRKRRKVTKKNFAYWKGGNRLTKE